MEKYKEEGKLLRIFIGETDKHQRRPLYEWIVQQARSEGMAGATVLRGMVGYGAGSLIHTTKILRLSEDLPVIVEIVDTEAKIDAFLPRIEAAITEGLITIERAHIRLYRSEKRKK
jgi:uncharacterized protein